MPSPGASPAYRDGRHAAVALLRERVRHVEARVAALSWRDRRALPAAWRGDLARVAAQVGAPDATLDALAGAEAALDACEDRMEGAVLLASQTRVERARTASVRRRHALRVVGPTLAVVALLVASFGFHRWSVWRERVASAADCRSQEWCRRHGECDAVEVPSWPDHFRCGATSDADCAAAPTCAEDGACAALDRRCQAADDASCERSRGCAKDGRCVAWRGTCVIDTPRCLLRPACAEEGLCTVVDPGLGCQAATRDDCAHSAICRDRGACTPDGGRCKVASDDDCKGSAACREHGACVPYAGACLPREPAACRGSVQCTYWGLCNDVRGRCVPGADDCRRSVGCEHDGLCSLAGERCVAASESDCARSSGCHDGGRCTVLGGKCVP